MAAVILEEPEAFGVVEALPNLAILAGAGVAVGICVFSDAVVRGLFSTADGLVGWIPWLGSVVEAPLDSIEQKITSALGTAESYYDAQLGSAMDNLATLGRRVYSELAADALLDAAIAERVAHLLVRDVVHVEHETVTDVRTDVIDHTVTDVRAAAHVADAATAAAVGALTARVGALEGDIADVLEPTLESLRGRAREIEDGFTRAWDLLKQHEEALGLGAATATVAVALEQLGAQWIRCDSNGALGSSYCGLPANLLKDILAAVAVVASGQFNLPALARDMQAALEDVDDAVASFWTKAGTGTLTNPGLGQTGL